MLNYSLFRIYYMINCLLHRQTLPWFSAGQQVKHEATKAIDVSSFIFLVESYKFWCAIGWCKDKVKTTRQSDIMCLKFYSTKITYFSIQHVVQQDVLRFEVTVNNAIFAQQGKSFCYLQQNFYFLLKDTVLGLFNFEVLLNVSGKVYAHKVSENSNRENRKTVQVKSNAAYA